MTALHDDEVEVDRTTVRRLVADQFPEWADLPLRAAGHGTDNVMLRLGDDLVVRLPRTAGTAADVAKERAWLPRLARHLPVAVPAPVARGEPGHGYPFDWSVSRWIDGEHPVTGSGAEAMSDWPAFGRDLAAFVAALHAAPLMGADRDGDLRWYRGRPLATMADDGRRAIAACRRIPGLDLDMDVVEAVFEDSLAVPDPPVEHTWLHGDLRAENLVVRDGRLAGVLDFGCLSVGNPTAEHAAAWELPASARAAYRRTFGLDDATWGRARGWALLIGLLGIPYYRTTWPAFAHDCVAKVGAVLADAVG